MASLLEIYFTSSLSTARLLLTTCARNSFPGHAERSARSSRPSSRRTCRRQLPRKSSAASYVRSPRTNARSSVTTHHLIDNRLNRKG